jgi:hypothetical protein
MPTKRIRKAVAIKQDKPIAIRLELKPAAYDRLDKQAQKRGLHKASLARMIILEWMDEQEGGAK